MVLNYGTTVIPSDNYSVISGGTVAVSAAFERTVGFVGGMDTANGSSTPGDLETVASPSEAQTLFGQGSELHEQVKMAYSNGASLVYAVAVPETNTTETFTGTDSGTLGNVPVMDPTIHDEHDITAQDTVEAASVTVEITYEDTPTAPTDANTIALNPVNGNWTADESSDYDITYTYGDYGPDTVNPVLDQEPRIVSVLTENESVVNNVGGALNSLDDGFNFMHSVMGAKPFADPTSPDTANYSDGVDEERVSLVASPRGYIDVAETDQHRTLGAVAGYLAGLPLGLSSTNDEIAGLTGLRTDLTPSGAGDLIDKQVMPLIDYPPVTIVKDMTTSTTQKFERVYAMQVIDEVTELSHIISREFVGEQNTDAQRRQLRRSHLNMLSGLANSAPPLLNDFVVNVSVNSSDPNQVDLELGIDVVDVMDTINVTVTVGDIVRATVN